MSSQSQFEKRQQYYEKKYRSRIYNYLVYSYDSVASFIEENGLNSDWYEIIYSDVLIYGIYEDLYKNVTLSEATIEYNMSVKPYLPQKKDIINDLVSILGGGNDNVINLWRSLLSEFIAVRITGRIQDVTATTERRIKKIVETGLNENESIEDVARAIRKEGKSEFNKNRSLAIARTETITSMNQGKYIAADSSPYVMVKKWSPVNDARTRGTHKVFLNSGYIDLKTPFQVPLKSGGFEPAQYPGDLNLSAENVIQCRCSGVYKPKKDKNGRLIRKDLQGVKSATYTYKTIIEAVCPDTGKLLKYDGVKVYAKSKTDAEKWLNDNGFGYCKVIGRLI